MKRLLSKSQFTRGSQCQKSLWLYRNKPQLKDPIDPAQQERFDAGTEFGKLAMQRFPNGRLIEASHTEPELALEQTVAALREGVTTLYEAAFVYDDVLVRVDVLIKNPSGTWDMIEVKSATEVKEVYLIDVAIQRYVLAGAGIMVARAYVAFANSAYVRRGEVDVKALFAMQEIGEDGDEARDAVPIVLKSLKAVCDAPEAPNIAIGAHCKKPYACDFEGTCWAHVPDYSVFNLAYAKMDKKLELWNSGVREVRQINPNLTKLSANQKKQVEAARAGQPKIDLKEITEWLKGLRWPLVHLDFETHNPVVPPFDGLRPYSQMPFQASVRVQHTLGGPVFHEGFLGDGLNDPRWPLAKFLCKAIPPGGTVLAYSKSFESGRLKELAQHTNIDYITSIDERLQDLADAFSKAWYVHPAFCGRWSIKAVLPVLVPDMSYKDLDIQDGAAAMAAYAELRDPALNAGRRAFLTNGLEVYCAQDTLAMVRILDHLFDIAEGDIVPV